MIKFGIVKKKDLLAKKTFFGRTMKVSIPLVLEQFHAESAENQDYSYFSEIKIGGTFKKTVCNRFAALDEFLCGLLTRNFADAKTLFIHDMAVSSGVTSVEFFDKLLDTGLPINFTASDKFTHVYILHNRKYNYKIVLGPDLEFMQFVFLSFVIDEEESRKDVLNYLMMKYVLSKIYPLSRNIIRQCGINLNEFLYETFFMDCFEITRVPLLSKKVINQCQVSPDFNFLRHDIFEETSDEFDVVRAMNILNLSYFDRSRLSLITNNILNKMKNNGVFIVGRTPDNGSNDTCASVFIKKDNAFHLLADYCGGSEVKEIVLNC